MAIIPNGFIAIAKAANATLTAKELFTDDHVIVATNAITLTLPTPNRELSRYGKARIFAGNGAVTLSCTGNFVGNGNSKNVTTLCYVELEVIPVSGANTSYKWAVVGEAANLAELTADQLLAVQGANAPAAGNVFATMADVPAAELTADELAAINGAAAPTALNVFATMADVPAAELTADELAAINGAASPDAGNVFATMADIPSIGFDYTRTGLTGGTANDLDGITYALLSEGHICRTDVSGKVYYHRWSAASALAESSPWVIRADDDGGAAGRWLLEEIHADMIDVSDAAAKAAPIDADLILIGDTADSNRAKKSTVAEVRSSLLSADGFGGAIAALAAKAAPIDADSIVVCDSADTNDAKETTIGELRSVMLASDGLGTGIAALDAKAAPIDADSIVVVDSADTNNAKETTIGELKAVILSADSLGGGIAALAAKAAPIDADSIVVVDSADTNDAKETTIAELRSVMLASDGLGTGIAALDAKAAPIDADSIVVVDSADTNNAKETTIGELKAVVLSADSLGGAIAALAAKAAPIAADSVVVVDSADTNDAKETTIAELGAVILAADPLGTAIVALDAKATPVDADSFVLVDSADTNNAKEITFAQLKAMLASTVGSYSPTIALTGGAAATVTAEVYQHKTFYDWCQWTADISGTDGGGATTLTLDFDAARVPADVNAKIPICAQVSVGGAAYTNVVGTLDCEAAAGGDRHLVVALGTLTDDAAFRIILSGAHKITPA